MSEPLRRFRIEGGSGRAVQHAIVHEAPALPVEPGTPGAAERSIGEAGSAILAELKALRAIVDPMRGVIENFSMTHRDQLQSVISLRDDMSEIESAISGTKKELAAITVGNNIGGVDVAALELTTVVRQTEAATNDILAAGEKIESMAGAIQSETTLEAAKHLAHEIADAVTIIYMACNFQDLSGQRVTRVVDTLNFVESRIQRMIEAWGGLQSLHDLIETELKNKEEEKATEGAAALLTGPVPVNSTDHVDQDAIDALFN